MISAGLVKYGACGKCALSEGFWIEVVSKRFEASPLEDLKHVVLICSACRRVFLEGKEVTGLKIPVDERGYWLEDSGR